MPPISKGQPLRDDVIDQISPNDLDELYTNDEDDRAQPIAPGFGNGLRNGFGGVFTPGGFGGVFGGGIGMGPQIPFGPPAFSPGEVKNFLPKFKNKP